jgi:hypothetical protein
VRRLIAALIAVMLIAAALPAPIAAEPPCAACCHQARVQTGGAPIAACCRLDPVNPPLCEKHCAKGDEK